MITKGKRILRKKIPHIFGLKEPYLNIILYLGNQKYHPDPNKKTLKIKCFKFYLRGFLLGGGVISLVTEIQNV